MKLAPEYKARLDHALEHSGQRSTKQREHIFSVILEKRDHPTADEVYARAKGEMPTISLATVYNCLETLVESGLVKQVNFEREPTLLPQPHPTRTLLLQGERRDRRHRLIRRAHCPTQGSPARGLSGATHQHRL